MDVAQLFRCPSCRARDMSTHSRQVVCQACGRGFPERGGYVDLLDPSARGEPTAWTAEQRLMESELVARLYDRFWRPAFVRAFAGGGPASNTGGFSGEFFIHKNALGMDEREGPWLDLSSGPGTFTRAMAAVRPGDWVIGLDISRAMLDVAVRRARGYSNVVLIRGDAHDLPIADDALGGVNNAGALHVYDDPEAVFSEVYRVLRPGGIYVGNTFSPSSSLLGKVAARAAGIRRFAPAELRAWLSRIGFSDFEDVRLGDAFVFRARKP